MSTTINKNIPDIVQTTNTLFSETITLLQDFLSQQTELKDYNYEGSNLKQLINLSALNTMLIQHFLAAGLFESSIYTATKRNSVVQAAQDIYGYFPHNYLSSKTTVKLILKHKLNVETITLRKGSQFTGNILGGNTYNFVNWDDIQIVKDISNTYIGNIPLIQGRIVKTNFTYDSSLTQKIIISDEHIDRDYMRVYVNGSLWNNWTSNSFTDTSASSNIYYVRENYVGQTEIYFGEGEEISLTDSNYVGGLKPANNSIITVEYLNTKGSEANGCTKFLYVDSIENVSVVSITDNPFNNINYTGSIGGQEPENIEKIRTIAPIYREAQNRCVVDLDYEAFVYNKFGLFIQLVRCYTDTEKPGYAFIAIKPIGGISLDTYQKNEIKQYLKKYNVSPISPVIIEPNYLFIKHDIYVEYKQSFLSENEDSLKAKILESINLYYTKNVETFGNLFHVSKLLTEIDKSHYSILGSRCEIELILELYNYFSTSLTGSQFNNLVENKLIYSLDIVFSGKNLEYNIRFAVTEAKNDTSIGQVIIGPLDILDVDPSANIYTDDDFIKKEEGLYYSVGTYDYNQDKLIFNLGNIGINSDLLTSQYVQLFANPVDDNIYTKQGTLIVYDNKLRPQFTKIQLEAIQ